MTDTVDADASQSDPIPGVSSIPAKPVNVNEETNDLYDELFSYGGKDSESDESMLPDFEEKMKDPATNDIPCVKDISEESVDIYSGILPGEFLTPKRRRKSEEIQTMYQQCLVAASQLEVQNQQLLVDVKSLTDENDRLKNNISSLYKTAKAEISRKDKEIVRLRRDLWHQKRRLPFANSLPKIPPASQHLQNMGWSQQSSTMEEGPARSNGFGVYYPAAGENKEDAAYTISKETSVDTNSDVKAVSLHSSKKKLCLLEKSSSRSGKVQRTLDKAKEIRSKYMDRDKRGSAKERSLKTTDAVHRRSGMSSKSQDELSKDTDVRTDASTKHVSGDKNKKDKAVRSKTSKTGGSSRRRSCSYDSCRSRETRSRRDSRSDYERRSLSRRQKDRTHREREKRGPYSCSEVDCDSDDKHDRYRPRDRYHRKGRSRERRHSSDYYSDYDHDSRSRHRHGSHRRHESRHRPSSRHRVERSISPERRTRHSRKEEQNRSSRKRSKLKVGEATRHSSRRRSSSPKSSHSKKSSSHDSKPVEDIGSGRKEKRSRDKSDVSKDMKYKEEDSNEKVEDSNEKVKVETSKKLDKSSDNSHVISKESKSKQILDKSSFVDENANNTVQSNGRKSDNKKLDNLACDGVTAVSLCSVVEKDRKTDNSKSGPNGPLSEESVDELKKKKHHANDESSVPNSLHGNKKLKSTGDKNSTKTVSKSKSCHGESLARGQSKTASGHSHVKNLGRVATEHVLENNLSEKLSSSKRAPNVPPVPENTLDCLFGEQDEIQLFDASEVLVSPVLPDCENAMELPGTNSPLKSRKTGYGSLIQALRNSKEEEGKMSKDLQTEDEVSHNTVGKREQTNTKTVGEDINTDQNIHSVKENSQDEAMVVDYEEEEKLSESFEKGSDSSEEESESEDEGKAADEKESQSEISSSAESESDCESSSDESVELKNRDSEHEKSSKFIPGSKGYTMVKEDAKRKEGKNNESNVKRDQKEGELVQQEDADRHWYEQRQTQSPGRSEDEHDKASQVRHRSKSYTRVKEDAESEKGKHSRPNLEPVHHQGEPSKQDADNRHYYRNERRRSYSRSRSEDDYSSDERSSEYSDSESDSDASGRSDSDVSKRYKSHARYQSDAHRSGDESAGNRSGSESNASRSRGESDGNRSGSESDGNRSESESDGNRSGSESYGDKSGSESDASKSGDENPRIDSEIGQELSVSESSDSDEDMMSQLEMEAKELEEKKKLLEEEMKLLDQESQESKGESSGLMSQKSNNQCLGVMSQESKGQDSEATSQEFKQQSSKVMSQESNGQLFSKVLSQVSQDPKGEISQCSEVMSQELLVSRGQRSEEISPEFESHSSEANSKKSKDQSSDLIMSKDVHECSKVISKQSLFHESEIRSQKNKDKDSVVISEELLSQKILDKKMMDKDQDKVVAKSEIDAMDLQVDSDELEEGEVTSDSDPEPAEDNKKSPAKDIDVQKDSIRKADRVHDSKLESAPVRKPVHERLGIIPKKHVQPGTSVSRKRARSPEADEVDHRKKSRREERRSLSRERKPVERVRQKALKSEAIRSSGSGRRRSGDRAYSPGGHGKEIKYQDRRSPAPVRHRARQSAEDHKKSRTRGQSPRRRQSRSPRRRRQSPPRSRVQKRRSMEMRDKVPSDSKTARPRTDRKSPHKEKRSSRSPWGHSSGRRGPKVTSRSYHSSRSSRGRRWRSPSCSRSCSCGRSFSRSRTPEHRHSRKRQYSPRKSRDGRRRSYSRGRSCSSGCSCSRSREGSPGRHRRYSRNSHLTKDKTKTGPVSSAKDLSTKSLCLSSDKVSSGGKKVLPKSEPQEMYKNKEKCNGSTSHSDSQIRTKLLEKGKERKRVIVPQIEEVNMSMDCIDPLTEVSIKAAEDVSSPPPKKEVINDALNKEKKRKDSKSVKPVLKPRSEEMVIKDLRSDDNSRGEKRKTVKSSSEKGLHKMSDMHKSKSDTVVLKEVLVSRGKKKKSRSLEGVTVDADNNTIESSKDVKEGLASTKKKSSDKKKHLLKVKKSSSIIDSLMEGNNTNTEEISLSKEARVHQFPASSKSVKSSKEKFKDVETKSSRSKEVCSLEKEHVKSAKNKSAALSVKDCSKPEMPKFDTGDKSVNSSASKKEGHMSKSSEVMPSKKSKKKSKANVPDSK